MTISIGTRFGPYEIVEAIGAGGMGEVWKAHDTRLGREVALKFLPEDFAANEKLLARFEREAKVISSLNHPNICTLYDVGEDAGKRYLVMELIEGESLADRLTKGPLPLPQVLKYGAQIAGALEKAHKQGIIHRDLKPGNVMLTKSDAKLLDFGLARSTEEQTPVQGLTDLPTAARPLTEEGTILGTFQYMAPEQLEGEEAGPRTDIFALGALLYEMATGKRAFEGKTRTSLIAAIVSSQPAPVSSIVDVAPPALDHVIRQCLEKDPEDRWQSAHDVARELQWISEGGSQVGVPAVVTSKRRRRDLLKNAAIVVLVALSAALGWLAWRGADETPARRVALQIDLPDGWKPSFVPVVSPDGTRIAIPAFKGAESAIWVRSLDSHEATMIAGTESADEGVFWSPSSEEIAFEVNRELKRVAFDGRAPSKICSCNLFSGTWSTAGVIVGTPIWGQGLYRVDVSGGEPAPLTQLDASKREAVHLSPFFFPDGNRFAFLGRTALGVNSEIYIASLDDPTPRRVLSADGLNGILPGNMLLFAREGRLLAQEVDVDSASPIGDEVTVVDRIHYSADAATGYASGTGDVIAWRPPIVRKRTLRWRDRAGTIVGETGFTGTYSSARLSPDAKRAVVAKSGDNEIGTDLWVLEFDRKIETRLTTHPDQDIAPLWTPDGRSIFFTSGRAGLYDLFTVSSDGGRPAESFLGDELRLDKYARAFTHDGRSLLIEVQERETSRNIYVVDMTTRAATPLLKTEAFEGPRAVSPDGEWLAYVSGQSGRNEVYIQRFDGTGRRIQISTEGGTSAHWFGDEILYWGNRTLWSVRVELQADTATVSSPVKLRDAIEEVQSWDTVDGQRFLTVDDLEEAPDRNAIQVLVNWNAEGR